jgi:hypothetical protein
MFMPLSMITCKFPVSLARIKHQTSKTYLVMSCHVMSITVARQSNAKQMQGKARRVTLSACIKYQAGGMEEKKRKEKK